DRVDPGHPVPLREVRRGVAMAGREILAHQVLDLVRCELVVAGQAHVVVLRRHVYGQTGVGYAPRDRRTPRAAGLVLAVHRANRLRTDPGHLGIVARVRADG